jgi:hypothetical protein
MAEANLVGINRVLMIVCYFSRYTSVGTLLRRREAWIHYYVIFWLFALSAILILGPASGFPRWFMVGIAFYRLEDLIFSTLDNVLGLTKFASADSYAWQTLLVIALVNIVQIVIIFAIANVMIIGHNPHAFSQPPTDRFDFFFMSWISLPALGPGATALSTMAKALTILEEATGLLMIVIAIGRFLSAPPSTPQASCPSPNGPGECAAAPGDEAKGGAAASPAAQAPSAHTGQPGAHSDPAPDHRPGSRRRCAP